MITSEFLGSFFLGKYRIQQCYGTRGRSVCRGVCDFTSFVTIPLTGRKALLWRFYRHTILHVETDENGDRNWNLG